MKDEEADGERALPRGARHPADYVIVMTCTGFVENWTGLLICRVLLGVFE